MSFVFGCGVTTLVALPGCGEDEPKDSGGRSSRDGADGATDDGSDGVSSTNSIGSSDMEGDGSDGDGATESNDDTEGSTEDPQGQPEGVDILFVIDNSHTMARHQFALGQAMQTLIAGLETANPAIDYRIAVTSSDNGHVRSRHIDACEAPGTGGVLNGKSCSERDSDFNCSPSCTLLPGALTFVPTTTDKDSKASIRPWVERVDGQKNLAEGIESAEALACLLPVGVDGCGWEAPLESMARALERSETPGDPAEGFHRKDSLLAVVLVTDEADCSHNHESSEVSDIFDPHIATFWGEGAQAPTSAICWNAGVECEGDDGAQYESCAPVDRLSNGKVSAQAGDDAALFPMRRYYERLDRFGTGLRTPLVFAIVGAAGPNELYYPSIMSGGSVENYGSAPGCEKSPEGGGSITAIPPVRIAALAERYRVDDEVNLYSICDDDFTEEMAALAHLVVGRLSE